MSSSYFNDVHPQFEFLGKGKRTQLWSLPLNIYLHGDGCSHDGKSSRDKLQGHNARICLLMFADINPVMGLWYEWTRKTELTDNSWQWPAFSYITCWALFRVVFSWVTISSNSLELVQIRTQISNLCALCCKMINPACVLKFLSCHCKVKK